MTVLRALGAFTAAVIASALCAGPAQAEALAQLDPVPVMASATCAGTVSAEAQVAPVAVDDHVENGVRVTINYDAGVYDGSCALTVHATWTNLDTGGSGGRDIAAVSTIDGHYGFVGYADTTFETGRGTVVVTLSSHPGAEMRVNPL